MKEGWEYKKLGAVADFCRGLTYKREDEVDSSDNCVLRSNNIDLESMSLNFEELKYIRPDFVIPEDKKLKANSVFVCMSNGSKQHVGKVAYVNEDMNYAFGGFMGLIVPKPQVSGKYIYYVCRSSLFRHFLDQIGNGIGITNLRFSDLNEFSIPFPPLSEQQHIVEELDLLSTIIEKKKAQLNELDNLAQSLFYEMFGSPTINEKGFPLLTVNDVIKFEGGSQPPKTSFEYTPTSNNIRLIQIRDYKTDAYITYVPKKLARKFCDEDDIMIGRYGPPIFQILKGLSGAYNVALMKAVPLKGNKEFVRAYLKQKCLLHYLETFSRRVAGQDGIQMDKLKAYPFPYPPIDLQNQFASKIEAIEQQKELIKQSIKEVETLFNSRMDYSFN